MMYLHAISILLILFALCAMTVKLMSRIVDAREASRNDFAYGITSDPLTQFASVFSALVHDVDHSGAPNNQLVKEGGMLAIRYNNKSVAEQNRYVRTESNVGMQCSMFRNLTFAVLLF